MDTSVAARPYASSDAAGYARRDAGALESAVSATSWGAIFAGAAVAAAASMILLSLGAGLGLASISPISSGNPTVTSFTIMTGIWLIVVQWLASGLGGYMTGRLRTRWVSLHTDEVFFRDTAHGLLAWAVATLLVAAILAYGTAAALGSGARAVGSAGASAMQSATNGAANTGGGDVDAYVTDTLFRAPQPSANGSSDAERAEATRILARGIANGDVPAADRSYLATLVAARTSLGQADAEKRVDAAIAQAKEAAAKVRQAADTARKASSAFSIFTALSMVIGAFIACVAAVFGGRLRDQHA
jgi:hypothetical protein